MILTKQKSAWLPLAPFALLLIQLVAMLFTNEVAWNVTDFIVVALLLSVIAGSIYLSQRIQLGGRSRTALIVIVILAVVLIWVELAVGIFGSPLAGS